MGSPHTCPDPVTAVVFALKSSAMYSCLYVFDEKNQMNRSWIHAHIQWCQLLMKWLIIIFIKYPASDVLMYYAVLITGGTYRSLGTPLWQDRLLSINYDTGASQKRLLFVCRYINTRLWLRLNTITIWLTHSLKSTTSIPIIILNLL